MLVLAYVADISERQHLEAEREKLIEELQGRNYASLELKTHIFEDETHVSVIPAAMSRGLRAVFE